MERHPAEAVCGLLRRRLGAAAVRLVEADGVPAVREALGLGGGTWDVASLGGLPVFVPDLRDLGREARAAGACLVVDNTLATSSLCPAARLGAHVVLESLDATVGERGSGLVAVGLSRDAPLRPAAPDSLSVPGERLVSAVGTGIVTLDARMRAACDAAQVVASYLSCHPAVSRVSYPGLPGDACNRVASCVLRDGFGPCIDFALEGDPCGVRARAVASAWPSDGDDALPGGRASRLELVEGAPSPESGVEPAPSLRLVCAGDDARALALVLERLVAGA